MEAVSAHESVVGKSCFLFWRWKHKSGYDLVWNTNQIRNFLSEDVSGFKS